jgi:hypothetical protein
MSSEMEESNYTAPSPTEPAKVSVLDGNVLGTQEAANSEPSTLESLETSAEAVGDELNQQFKQVSDRFAKILGGLPDYLSGFFGEYRQPVVTVLLILGALLAVKLTLALLDALDDVPLLAPTFELIGFAYTVWFIYRYLLKASNRQELSGEVQALKDQIIGGKGFPKS